jgi:glycosyltransferase involved in cell wall biosynthesis
MISGGMRKRGVIKHSSENIPLITVVTVVYNGEMTLENTILSVISQTYKNIEYIIIDGASTDKTFKIINKYNNNIDYWISEPDDGLYYAMNKGISLALGDWINFMNSGDSFYTPNTIQDLVNKNYLKNEQAVIYGNRVLNDNNKLLIERKVPNVNEIKYYMSIFHQSCFINVVLHRNFLYNTLYKIAADYDLFYRMTNQRITFIRTDLIVCVFMTNGISCNINLQLKEVIRIIKSNNKNIVFRLIYTILCLCRPMYLSYHLYKYFPALHKFLSLIYHKVRKDNSYLETL